MQSHGWAFIAHRLRNNGSCTLELWKLANLSECVLCWASPFCEQLIARSIASRYSFCTSPANNLHSDYRLLQYFFPLEFFHLWWKYCITPSLDFSNKTQHKADNMFLSAIQLLLSLLNVRTLLLFIKFIVLYVFFDTIKLSVILYHYLNYNRSLLLCWQVIF